MIILDRQQILNKHAFLYGGVVAYPVMQAHGSLALEDNPEVGEAVLGRCIISSQSNKHTQILQWVLLGEDSVISPT